MGDAEVSIDCMGSQSMLSSVLLGFVSSVALGFAFPSSSTGNFALEVALFFEENSIILE